MKTYRCNYCGSYILVNAESVEDALIQAAKIFKCAKENIRIKEVY
jgi:DNA-directed RNA polymerase subunit RPC12/RpoP